MVGKTCVITGGTSGLGRAAAEALYGLGATVVLIGRNERAGAKVTERMQRKYRGSGMEFIRTDLSVQKQVRALGARIAAAYPSVDVLINSAGARFDSYQESADGIELSFATNHLSHFLLVSLLLDNLFRGAAGRVITVGSSSHFSASAGDWCLTRANYDRKVAYAKSKLANIMFAYELADRLRETKVTSNVADPGGVATNLGRNNGLISWLRHLVYYALKGKLLSSKEGAETIVYLAASPEVERVSGKYFFRKSEAPSSRVCRDKEAAKDLWRLSARLTELNGQIDSAGPFLKV